MKKSIPCLYETDFKEEMVHEASEMFKYNLFHGLTWLGCAYGWHYFRKYQNTLLESSIDQYIHIMKLNVRFSVFFQ